MAYAAQEDGAPHHSVDTILALLNAAQLKTIQEMITLVMFYVLSVLYPKEPMKWNYLAGLDLMVGAAFLIFKEC